MEDENFVKIFAKLLVESAAAFAGVAAAFGLAGLAVRRAKNIPVK